MAETKPYKNHGNMRFVKWMEPTRRNKTNRKALWLCEACGVEQLSSYNNISIRLKRGFSCIYCKAPDGNQFHPHEKSREKAARCLERKGNKKAVMFFLMLQKAVERNHTKQKANINLEELRCAWKLFYANSRLTVYD